MNTVGWCLTWITGCVIGLFAVGRDSAGIEPLYGQIILALGAICILPLILAWRDRQTRWLCLMAMAFLGGCGSALLTRPPITPSDLAYYNTPEDGPTMLVTGAISSEPVFTDRSQRVRFSAEQMRSDSESIPRPIKGDLYAVLPRYPEHEFGTRLALSGTLTAPPRLSEFDYPAYLARQGILSYMTFPKVTNLGASDRGWLGSFLIFARPPVREALQRGIPEPQAAIAVGVVTGDRSQIPDDVQDAFRRSGTSHIIAISGQNIALLTGVVWLFYGASSRRRMTIWAFAICAALITVYTIFTGASPAVVRAAIMGIILLFAPVVHRRYDPIGALAITATGMVIFDPDVLADVGFQLSFAAMLGIATLASPLYALTKRLHIPSLLALPIAVSLAAQAATLPLVALISGQISTVALPATLIAEIALLPLMVTGIVAGIFGAIFAPLAIPFGLLAWPFAAWIVWWVEFWAALPWASVDVSAANPAWVVVYYGLLVLCVWLVNRAKRVALGRNDFVMVGVLAIAITLWAVFAAVVLT
ncbi:MAG TPA: ComEC/Rec2 family competence protein [Chloroflexia bacterium]|nr:ComEC/Rec2 family competence protein [Chloroflexia bacterium]